VDKQKDPFKFKDLSLKFYVLNIIKKIHYYKWQLNQMLNRKSTDSMKKK
jgi:hypothetical protein